MPVNDLPIRTALRQVAIGCNEMRGRFPFHQFSDGRFNVCLTPPTPSVQQGTAMNELKVIAQRDKWEAEMEKHQADLKKIDEEFKKNPDVNPFDQGANK